MKLLKSYNISTFQSKKVGSAIIFNIIHFIRRKKEMKKLVLISVLAFGLPQFYLPQVIAAGSGSESSGDTSNDDEYKNDERTEKREEMRRKMRNKKKKNCDKSCTEGDDCCPSNETQK